MALQSAITAFQWSTEVPQTARADRGNIRRTLDPMAHPELGYYGCRTMYEGIRRGKEVNPLGPCLGFRAVSSNGMATPFIYSSYTECLARIDAFAAGLETLELVEPNDTGMIMIGLYMKNCVEWILAEHGVYNLGGTTVPLYDTLGTDAAEFILGQTRAKSVVCSREQLERLCKVKDSGNCPCFQYVILVDGVTPEASEQAKVASLETLSFAKVEAVGAQTIATQGHKHNPPTGKDVATLCYTSGTTGNPKGAMITHENLVSTVAGAKAVGCDMFDRHLSYLPLAHIFERVVQAQILMVGASIGFYRGDPLFLIDDLQACRPTILPVAPRVLNKIYDKIHAGVAAAGGFKKSLFHSAVAAKTRGLKEGRLTHPIYDLLIFNKIKKGLGMDHLRLMVSGSAPLSEKVMIFFRCVLGVPLLEGYGQTEGTAAATISHPDDMATVGHVGIPTEATEIVLVDVPEMGYLHTDKSHAGKPCQGRGEIFVRGPNVFKGYYKDEEKTKETVDEEGWLRSGDIGLWTMDGNLQIVDRKKNLFKLSQGEYVAPEKIENVLLSSSFIAQCFVYGDSFQSTLVAIIVPDEEPVIQWARSSDDNISSASFEQLCKSEQLKDAIMNDIKKISRASGLQGFETVRAIHIDHMPFTVENGLVTPTFKLKRQQARDRYERQISEMYDNMPTPKSRL